MPRLTSLSQADTGDVVILHLLLVSLSICLFHSSGKPPSCILSNPAEMPRTFSSIPLLRAPAGSLRMNSSSSLTHPLHLRALFSESTSRNLWHNTVTELPALSLCLQALMFLFYQKRRESCLNVKALALKLESPRPLMTVMVFLLTERF